MMKKICKLASPLLLGALFASGPALAFGIIDVVDPPDFDNTYDTAVIDGQYGDGEWDLTENFFAPMHEAGDIPTADNTGKALFSNSYLRYDCNTNTMFVLVLDKDLPNGDITDDGLWPLKQVDNAWVDISGFKAKKVSGSHDNGGVSTGSPSEFSWAPFDGLEGSTLDGWEGSFKIDPGNYDIQIHVNMTGSRTSSTGKSSNLVGLFIRCDDTPPTPNPGITIEKATNGKDSDVAPGENLAVGSPVAWTYTVTNTGDVDLDNIDVTDDIEGSITCPDTVLAAGDEMICTANGSAILGSYSNIGTVTGTYEGGAEPVTAFDPSYYTGTPSFMPAPAIDIETSTNGHDADNPTGPTLLVGQPVTWEYVVKNTGNVDLEGIDLSDSVTGGVICPKSYLAAHESMTCIVAGLVTAEQYANEGCVDGAYVGYDEEGNEIARTTVDDCDPSHYFGADPQLDIETHTQGFDADDSTGPFIEAGDPVYGLYSVTNTGNVPLTNIAVTDDQGIVVNCGNDSNIIAELQPKATFNCSGTGTAIVGQYENFGTAESDFTDYEGAETPPVTASDPSHYFGAEPGIDIETCTSNVALAECLENDPANHDSPFGAAFLEGETVIWTYTITNTGNVPLNNVVADDDRGVVLTCSTDFDGTLLAGESVTCTGSDSAVLDQYSNKASTSGNYTVIIDENSTPEERTAEDMDPSHYYGFSPYQPSLEVSVTDYAVTGPANQFNNGTFIVENASGDVSAVLLQDVSITIEYRSNDDNKWVDVPVQNTCTTTPAIPFVLEGPGEWVDQADRGQQAFDFKCTAEEEQIPAGYSSARATVCVQLFNREDKVKGKLTGDEKWFCTSSDM